MKRLLFIAVISATAALVSCGDFLKEYSQDLAYARSCDDLDEIMVGNAYMARSTPSSISSPDVTDTYYTYLHLMDDDVRQTNLFMLPVEELCYYENIYLWQANPYTSSNKATWENKDWERLYKHIAHLNVILSLVDDFSSDPEEQRRRLIGECSFLRAAYYFMLVNIFAEPYDATNADNQPGVPLKLTEFVDHEPFSRNSVGQVYRQIVKDLETAIDNLEGVVQKNFYRVDQKASHAFLARVYLYMGEWEKAAEQGRIAIDKNISLFDLNNFNLTGTRDYIMAVNSPEILFTMGSNSQTAVMMTDSWTAGVNTYSATDELMSMYHLYDHDGITDLRESCYYVSSNVYKIVRKVPTNSPKIFDAFLLRSAEVYLNKAEAEAMDGDTGAAVATLTHFLERRYEDGVFPAISGMTQEQLVKFIRDERRRELSFENHRWLDLRRYAVAAKFPETKSIFHTLYKYGSGAVGTCELKPYGEDNAWVMPIPIDEIEINQGALVDNPQREEREML